MTTEKKDISQCDLPEEYQKIIKITLDKLEPNTINDETIIKILRTSLGRDVRIQEWLIDSLAKKLTQYEKPRLKELLSKYQEEKREELWNLFEAQTGQCATYTRKGKEYSTNTFKEWNRKRKGLESDETLKRQEEQIAEEMISEIDLRVLDDTKQILVRENMAYLFEMRNFEDGLKEKIDRIDAGSYVGIKTNILAMIQDDKRVRIKREEFYNQSDVIPFLNGIYHFGEERFLTLKEFDKPFFYEISHTYKNDKEYDCPKFKKLLTQWIYKKIETKYGQVLYIPQKVLISDIFEAIGLTLTMNTGFKKHFIPLGETDSGKTQFGNIRNTLFDIRNMAGTTLQRIGKNEFGTDNLQFKVCLAVDELPNGVIKQTGPVKDLLGGTTLIQGEIKGGNKFLFRPYLKAWFNANEPPYLKNPNDLAFYNRFIFIPFLNKFIQGTKEYIDAIWKEIVNDPDEMQGIMHESIKGYMRLNRRKGFRRRLSKNTKHVWLYGSDSLYKFLYDYTDKDNSYHGKITAEEFKEKFAVEMQVAWSPQYLYKRLAKYGIIRYMSDKTQKIRGIKWKEGIWDEEEEKPSVEARLFTKKKLDDFNYNDDFEEF